MSGIVGVLYLNESSHVDDDSRLNNSSDVSSNGSGDVSSSVSGEAIATHDIALMLKALSHRGADGQGTWCKGAVGLGHRLLWTTPESQLESLPQQSNHQRWVITADARIDNRDELLLQLQLPDKAIHEITDSEFILAAYEKWGDRCAENLLGDFAFVIWDSQQQQLLCIRDHFGVKPLYYYKADNIFVFASEIKGLLAHPAVSTTVNQSHILNHLTLYFEDKASTAYNNIYRLPPAHTLTVSKTEGLALRQYWALDPDHEIQLSSDAEYEAAFYRIFSEAVRCRLRSALPVGAHLSGGLDSSSIVCVARSVLAASGDTAAPATHQPPTLHTFSNIYPDVSGSDEQSHIAHVVSQGSLSPHYIRADLSGPLTEQDQLFDHVDEPLIGNSYLVLGLNKAAQAENVRIVLNGYDGDTTVSHGTLRLQELVDNNDWKTFVFEVKALKQNASIFEQASIRSSTQVGLKRWAKRRSWLSFCCASWHLSSTLNMSFAELLYKYGVRSVTASWKKRLKSLQKSRLQKSHQHHPHPKGTASGVSPFVQPDFSRQAGLASRPAEKCSTRAQTVRKKQWKTFTYGITAAIEVMDVLAAPYNIEARYPFMDKRLVEFCLALPAEQKLKNGWTRSILRRAMQGTLPEAIQWREGKTTPAAALKHGLEHYDRALIESILADEDKVLERYVSTDVLTQAYDAFLADRPDNRASSGQVWAALSLKLWLQNQQIVKNKEENENKRVVI